MTWRRGWVDVVEYDVPDRVGNGSGELVGLLTTIPDDVPVLADVVPGAGRGQNPIPPAAP